MGRKCVFPWQKTLLDPCHHDGLDREVYFAMERHTSSPCYAYPHLGLVLCPHDETSGQKIQGLGIKVKYIPGGCTYMCQPIDVGVNKPLKNKMTDLWEE